MASHPALTETLAQSFKNGLMLPTEKKFAQLEQDMTVLQQQIELNHQQKTAILSHQLTEMEAKIAALAQTLRISATLALSTLITSMIILATVLLR